MNIKIDQADKLFSLYIRLRDKHCVACGRVGEPDKEGRSIIGLQASHYWSRRNESTRYDTENVDSLCFHCHHRWGGDYREEYKAFKMKQLGKKRYQTLEILAHTYKKKDRKMELIKAKALLQEYV